MNRKNVLIIGTKVATNGLESGGSLRINGIKELLMSLGLNVHVVSRRNARKSLSKKWDLIVLVSFATARFLHRARKSSDAIWFDPTDSWRLTRFSLIRGGGLKHFPLLLRDLFWIWTSPRIDLLTFITKRDSEYEKFWWSKRLRPIIYPIHDLTRVVHPSSEIRLVFVGDGSYGPNAEAITFLTKVLQLLPVTIQIHIYGRGFRNLDARFVYHGYTSNQEMYFENDVHLAPISSGAGLKLKVALPLSNGLRVISTPEGANGLKQNPKLLIAPDEKSFAALILQLQVIRRINRVSKSRNIYEVQEQPMVTDWIMRNILSPP